jgi:hypothetical protein
MGVEFYMGSLNLKHVTVIALSLWLGCLACVLGCVQPVSASSPPISELKATANEDDNDRMADSAPCCHHSGKTSERSKQGSTNSSCCGLNATLTQKQDPKPPLRICLSVFVLSLLVSHSSVPFSVGTDASVPIAWLAGRDVLLQAHILRI